MAQHCGLAETAEIVDEFMCQGSHLYIEGKLQITSWEDRQSVEKKYQTEIVANDLVLLGSREKGNGAQPQLIFPVRLGTRVSCAQRSSSLCVVAERSDDHKQMIVTAFDPLKGRGAELLRLDVDPSLDVAFNNLICVLSPDGTRLATAWGTNSPIEIYSLRTHGVTTIPVKGLDRLWSVSWAADQNGLYVSRHVAAGTELLYVDFKGRISRLWKSLGDKCFGRPSPDGRHIAIYDWKRNANMWMIEASDSPVNAGTSLIGLIRTAAAHSPESSVVLHLLRDQWQGRPGGCAAPRTLAFTHSGGLWPRYSSK